MSEGHRIRNISCKRQGKLANEKWSEMAELSVWFEDSRFAKTAVELGWWRSAAAVRYRCGVLK